MSNFKALQQIAGHLGKYKLKQIDIIGNDGSESRYTEFYNLLRDGQLEDDDAAACHFYGENANAQTPTYRKFKSNFLERLLNAFVFIDAASHGLSDRQAAGIYVYRDWLKAGMLQARGLGYAYIIIAERLITEALKFDFYDVALDLIVKIKGNIASQDGDKKLYTYYNDLYKRCYEILGLEYRARELFELIRINYVKSARFQPEQAKAACLAYEEIKPALEKYDSVNLHFYGRAIEAMQYSCINDYAKLLVAQESAISFFKRKSFECRLQLAAAYQSKLMCCIALRKYEEGEQTAIDCINMSVEGSVNWFKSLELQVTLYLHAGRYREAYDIYVMVKKNPNKSYLKETYQEMWLLLEAYLYFLISNRLIPNVDIKTADLGTFRLQKFLNDMTLYGNDKEGLNIPTLIVKIILMVSEKKENDVIDKLEALEKYRSRHIKGQGSYRTNQFIKVLAQLPITSFNAKRFENATKKYADNIKKVPVNVFEDGFKLEIVPYDIVREWMLTILVKNK